jgi:hypothetical protein
MDDDNMDDDIMDDDIMDDDIMDDGFHDEDLLAEQRRINAEVNAERQQERDEAMHKIETNDPTFTTLVRGRCRLRQLCTISSCSLAHGTYSSSSALSISSGFSGLMEVFDSVVPSNFSQNSVGGWKSIK